MTTSKTADLILIPSPEMGHLVPAVELAKQLVAREPRLSITVLIIRLPIPDNKLESRLLSLQSDPSLLNNGIRFLDITSLHGSQFDPVNAFKPGLVTHYMESFRSKVKLTVEDLQASEPPLPIAGFLLDMFCTAMIDVATDLGLPSYVFFTSGAGLLSMMFRLQELGIDVADEYDAVRAPGEAVDIPGFRNPVPVRVWPAILLYKDGRSADFLRHAKRYRQAKGILVNTFTELEWDLIHSMSKDNRIPPIYPVGPILNLDDKDQSSNGHEDAIFNWLDAQPPRSVVFLCFGSRGTFDEKQVKEIAVGLEGSGRRFLWSLRQRRSGIAPPSDFDDVRGVLPEGFLERTGEKGRVIGWAPQARVLGHGAIGGFVSHCGWNSMLESLWFGVPIAAWPVYAEQQQNAFELVKELGLAVEVRMDYREDLKMVVEAAEVEEGIRKVMEEEEGVREKVKDMSDKARKALGEGGSSYESLGRFVEGVFENIPLARLT